MKKLIFIILLIILTPFSVYAGMITGKLINLKTGDTLEMKIQKKWRGSIGDMTARNEKTDEDFKGQYTAIRGKEITNAFGNSYNYNGGGWTNNNGVGVTRSNVIPAQSTLLGNKQTVINCQFTIQAGWSPHGTGMCGDNKNEQYSLQF